MESAIPFKARRFYNCCSKTHDASVVDELIVPMPDKVKQVTADTAYDSNHVYHLLDNNFSHVDIVDTAKK